jgi:hypothetical protein
MTSKITKFICSITSFIYEVKHVAISQWEVENTLQAAPSHYHDKRQQR